MEDKLTIVYPPGSGGSFLAGLLMGESSSIRLNNNEYKCWDSPTIENIPAGKTIDDYDIIRTHNIYEASIANNRKIIIIDETDIDIQRYINILAIIKHLFNDSSIFYPQKSYKARCTTFRKIMYPLKVDDHFCVTKDIIDKLKYSKWDNKSKVNFITTLNNITLHEYIDSYNIDLYNQHRWGQHLSGSVTYRYKDLIIDQTNMGIFEPFKAQITQYHKDNLIALRQIDKKYNTNLEKYIAPLTIK